MKNIDKLLFRCNSICINGSVGQSVFYNFVIIEYEYGRFSNLGNLSNLETFYQILKSYQILVSYPALVIAFLINLILLKA